MPARNESVETDKKCFSLDGLEIYVRMARSKECRAAAGETASDDGELAKVHENRLNLAACYFDVAPSSANTRQGRMRVLRANQWSRCFSRGEISKLDLNRVRHDARGKEAPCVI